MFKSLYGRLLISYFAIIAVLLAIFLLFIFATRASDQERTKIIAAELSLISDSLSPQIESILSQSRSDHDLFGHLDNLVGKTRNLRVLIIVEQPNPHIAYDSHNHWDGQTVDARSVPSMFDGQENVGVYLVNQAQEWVFLTPPELRGQYGFVVLTRPRPSRTDYFVQVASPIAQSAIPASLLALLLASVVAGSVARPLRQLAKAAEAVGQGDYDQTLELNGPTEIRTVATSLMRWPNKLKRPNRRNMISLPMSVMIYEPRSPQLKAGAPLY